MNHLMHALLCLLLMSSSICADQVSAQTKSDFEPGKTVIFEDDFGVDALEDFPVKWNTNGSGKIVEVRSVEGKWLEIVHSSIVHPLLKKPLPENCTIEFDLFLQTEEGKVPPFIQFGFAPVKDILRENLYYTERFFVNINRYAEEDGKTIEYGLRDIIGNKNDFAITKYVNKVLPIAIAINGTRIRVYADQTKLIDLPRIMTKPMRNTFYISNENTVPASDLGVLIGNIRIASSEQDARSLLIKQLMEEGSAVTNDILFDVNSDKLQAGSKPILDQFGKALAESPSLRIRITGHTDSDGNAASNLDLSKRRAASVKAFLISNFKVEEKRIETDGKGATQPVAANSTADGKRKNRRVEFTKL